MLVLFSWGKHNLLYIKLNEFQSKFIFTLVSSKIYWLHYHRHFTGHWLRRLFYISWNQIVPSKYVVKYSQKITEWMNGRVTMFQVYHEFIIWCNFGMITRKAITKCHYVLDIANDNGIKKLPCQSEKWLQGQQNKTNYYHISYL